MCNTIKKTCIVFWLALMTIAATHCSGALAQDLLIPEATAPKYKLSELRIERDGFGRRVLVFDYEIEKAGEAPHSRVSLAGRTGEGELRLFGVPTIETSGTMEFSLTHSIFGPQDYEVYFVLPAFGDQNFLVSNVLSTGNFRRKTSARAMTTAEQKRFARHQLFKKPPTELPEGFSPVDQSTKLVAGMPVKAGHYGQWKDAEVVSFRVGGKVILKYQGESRLQSHDREKWIAVSPQVLDQVTTDPSQFKSKIRTLPNSLQILPDGATAVSQDIELPPGTPLLLDKAGSWRDVFVAKINSKTT